MTVDEAHQRLQKQVRRASLAGNAEAGASGYAPHPAMTCLTMAIGGICGDRRDNGVRRW